MAENSNNPLITFALFAYNQEKYIEDAVLGVFSQTYSPLEIILSDDCSHDNTFAIMEKMANNYKGPHTIILNRNKNNLGLIGHINKVFTEVVNGEIIVVGAGDDISLPERVKQTYKAFENDAEIISVSMNYQRISEIGDAINTTTSFYKGYVSLNDFYKTKKLSLLGSTRAYHKKVITIFGKLSPDSGVEDSNLVFRSLLLGKTFHINKIGVNYRVIKNSLSSSINLTQIEGVLKQRRLDSEKALKLQLIFKSDLDKIIELIKYFKVKHRLRTDFLISQKNLMFYFSHILFSKYFLVSEKLDLIKNYLKDKFGN